MTAREVDQSGASNQLDQGRIGRVGATRYRHDHLFNAETLGLFSAQSMPLIHHRLTIWHGSGSELHVPRWSPRNETALNGRHGGQVLTGTHQRERTWS
jgi:hypothetical protein